MSNPFVPETRAPKLKELTKPPLDSNLLFNVRSTVKEKISPENMIDKTKGRGMIIQQEKANKLNEKIKLEKLAMRTYCGCQAVGEMQNDFGHGLCLIVEQYFYLSSYELYGVWIHCV